MSQFSAAELKLLKLEFSKLKTLQQKFKFWEKELQINIIEFLLNFKNDPLLKDFYIDFEFQDWTEINAYILLQFTTTKKEVPGLIFLNLSKLKSEIKEKGKTTRDRRKLIITEIRAIEKSFLKPIGLNALGINNDIVVNPTYQADYKSFKYYLSFPEEPDYSVIEPGLKTIYFENGITLAKLYMFLKEELKKFKSRTSEIKSKPLTSNQIAMVFFFTGVFKNDQSEMRSKAKVIAALLEIDDKNFYDNLRNVGGKNYFAIDKDLEIKHRLADLDAVNAFLADNDLKRFEREVDNHRRRWDK